MKNFLTLLLIGAALITGGCLSVTPFMKEESLLNENVFVSILEHEDSFYRELRFLYSSQRWENIPALMEDYENPKSDIVGKIKLFNGGVMKKIIDSSNLKNIDIIDVPCMSDSKTSLDSMEDTSGLVMPEDNCLVDISNLSDVKNKGVALSYELNDSVENSNQKIEIISMYENGKTKKRQIRGTPYKKINTNDIKTVYIDTLEEEIKSLNSSNKVTKVSVKLSFKSMRSNLQLRINSNLVSIQNVISPLDTNKEDRSMEGLLKCGCGIFEPTYMITNNDIGICVSTFLREHRSITLNSLRQSKTVAISYEEMFLLEEIIDAKNKFDNLKDNSMYMQNKNHVLHAQKYEC